MVQSIIQYSYVLLRIDHKILIYSILQLFMHAIALVFVFFSMYFLAHGKYIFSKRHQGDVEQTNLLIPLTKLKVGSSFHTRYENTGSQISIILEEMKHLFTKSLEDRPRYYRFQQSFQEINQTLSKLTLASYQKTITATIRHQTHTTANSFHKKLHLLILCLNSDIHNNDHNHHHNIANNNNCFSLTRCNCFFFLFSWCFQLYTAIHLSIHQ